MVSTHLKLATVLRLRVVRLAWVAVIVFLEADIRPLSQGQTVSQQLKVITEGISEGGKPILSLFSVHRLGFTSNDPLCRLTGLSPKGCDYHGNYWTMIAIQQALYKLWYQWNPNKTLRLAPRQVQSRPVPPLRTVDQTKNNTSCAKNELKFLLKLIR